MIVVGGRGMVDDPDRAQIGQHRAEPIARGIRANFRVGFALIVHQHTFGPRCRALRDATLHDSKPQASWDDHFALDYWGAAV